MPRPKVVIVGAGFGGLQAAKHLSKAAVDLTLIDRQNHHLFQPLLYQVATANLSPAQIASPIRSVLRTRENVEVVLCEVTGVDKQKKEVIAGPRIFPYGYLILATGSRHSYFGHDAWEPFAPGLKTIVDATEIRQKILLAFEAAELETDPLQQKNLLHFILVGGGPTGVEMAGAISELSHRALACDFRKIDPKKTKITLIEAGPRILAAFPEELSQKAERALERLEVTVLVNSRVENIDAKGVWIQGKCLPSSTIIWTAGVAASPAGRWLSAEMDTQGRVKVNSDLSLPGFKEIFVIGDTAHLAGEGGRPLPGIAPVAMQQGRFVAKKIRSELRGKYFSAEFRYHDRGYLATIGRSHAVGVIRKLKLSGYLAWVLWLIVHIYYLIGFRNRLFVLLDWAWSYFTFQRGARLIVRKEKVEG